MKKTSKPILFFGSGPVAAKSLELLHKDFEIEAVVTKPRAPHHKGEVPVLDVAHQLKLPVETASTKQELDHLFSKKTFKSEVGVLIDFGIIVSQKVIDYFPFGIVNSHFSLLPEWRGADPITFSILSGQRQTGVSLMLLVEAMDEGPLLAQALYDIKLDETTGTLTEELIHLSASLLKTSLPKYLKGTLVPVPQTILDEELYDGPKVSYSRKLTKEDGLLSWAKAAKVLEREIRAFSDWPKSRIVIGGMELVITQAHTVADPGQPGTTAVINKQPVIFCGEGGLVLDRLKPAGKQEMTGEAFLAGYKKQFLGLDQD